MVPRKDFYNELWGPAYLLVNGQSPYDTPILDPVLPAVWLPMAIGFFFPLGWLPKDGGRTIIIQHILIPWVRENYSRAMLSAKIFLPYKPFQF